MEFIHILLANSTIKEAKLYNAAKKASENPAIGITIQNPAAHHVIKDCANITIQYLPLFVFGAFDKPFDTLKGKFKKEHIIELIEISKKTQSLNQLVQLITTKANEILNISVQNKPVTNKIDPNNPYGDYDAGFEESHPNSSNTSLSIEDLLCKAFAAC